MRFPPAQNRLNMPDMSLGEKQVSDSARSVKRKFPFTMISPHTPREFAKWTLAALPGARLLSVVDGLSAAETPAKLLGKSNSNVAGVQLGLNVPYGFADPHKLMVLADAGWVDVLTTNATRVAVAIQGESGFFRVRTL